MGRPFGRPIHFSLPKSALSAFWERKADKFGPPWESLERPPQGVDHPVLPRQKAVETDATIAEFCDPLRQVCGNPTWKPYHCDQRLTNSGKEGRLLLIIIKVSYRPRAGNLEIAVTARAINGRARGTVFFLDTREKFCFLITIKKLFFKALHLSLEILVFCHNA